MRCFLFLPSFNPKQKSLLVIKDDGFIFKVLTVFTFLIFLSCTINAQINVLVFSKTNGYRHASITEGKEMFGGMARENNWRLTFSEDSLAINKKNLAKTDVLILLNNSGNIFGLAEKKALLRYSSKGGGIVAIHGAVATEKGSEWYADLVGGAFKDHPKPQSATINIINREFKAMHHFDKSWLHFDEWYNLEKPLVKNAVVLANVDEKTFSGGTMGANHPVVWYQKHERGRVFTTTLGHTRETYKNADFVKMIKEAVLWAKKK